MGLNSNINQVIFELKSKEKLIPETIVDAQYKATKAAISKATELTPPTPDDGPRGENTITGELKESWENDSITTVYVEGDNYTTELNNYKDYASFVNDGHFLDEHFVPGLVKNQDTGLLDKVDPSLGGIVVGTQTKYIEGLYMSDQALLEYQKVLEDELKENITRNFKD